ncbi:hypothetical protein LJC64_03155, partial [Ruminococcaceae bacterium OttesenSCG-928-A11]|nr:hypothetical protein [Ruminococcaceae bacterium OttesenSCG-928-A11]
TTGGVGTALLAAGATAQIITTATVAAEAALLTGMISTMAGTAGMISEITVNAAKRLQNQRDSGLIVVSTDEIKEKLKDRNLDKKDKRRFEKELKARRERNKKTR